VRGKMVAEIILNSNAKELNRVFDYNIPETMAYKATIGSRVFVQFGNRKELEEGFIINIKDESEFKLKDIQKIVNENGISEEKVELAKLMARRYFCNVSECIKLMLPPGTTTKIIENRVKEKNENFVSIVNEILVENDIEENKFKSAKQLRILKFLLDNGETNLADLLLFTDTTRDAVKSLEKKKYVVIEQKQVERNPFLHKVEKKTSKLKFTDEQQYAYDEISFAMDKNKYGEYLIYGVTGSGKTEIYLQLIENALRNNKTSIMLVPEISLTPQTVDRFIARFGEENIAVLHSKLSIGERFDQWNKIKNGQAKIVIGARSAIFAPIKDLGIIIIDEEHDSSYKSESTPRYNAKDIARYLCKENNIPLVLGSATPDTSSLYRTMQKESVLLRLNKRANSSTLPEIEVIDLREELSKKNKTMLSEKLQEAIKENLENKKQTILFLNRRGFSTFVMCRDCGYTAKCKNCDITLTYHKSTNKLKCHYCGYETNVINKCPDCKSENIRYFGTGTQKLEAEINKLYPEAKTIRMDVDTVTKKNSHEKILTDFKENKADILIGTQMVVKGHHFPNVTLVGVIAADGSLNMNDYRANEITFQILTQVAGRAGRGKDTGKVIIQTYNPDSFAIECVKTQNEEMFYNTEMRLRKQLKYPPFCDIIVIGVSSKEEQITIKVTQSLHKYLKNRVENENIGIMLYKALPAPIDKIKNKYRWRILIKCKFGEDIIDLMNDTLQKAQTIKYCKNGDANISIDVNPTNMV
jgi:primosomal protein N'